MSGKSIVTVERVRNALVIVARLTAEDPRVLPIFMRLETEYAKLLAERDALARARRIAETGQVEITRSSPPTER